MPRLVAFGCSHTYGLGLPDCPTINNSPSKLSFPSVLGKMLDLEVLNKADTGASQKQISATILDTEIFKDDIVIINWSNPSRRGIWNGTHWEQLASWTEDKTWKKFYAKYHREADDVLDSIMNIKLANYYLNERCNSVINSLHLLHSEIISKTKIDIIFRDDNVYFKELKCGHPDQKSHEVFAGRLLELLNV